MRRYISKLFPSRRLRLMAISCFAALALSGYLFFGLNSKTRRSRDYSSEAFFTQPVPVEQYEAIKSSEDLTAEKDPRLPRVGLAQFIRTAEDEISFCMFRFDLAIVVDALVDAHHRGVRIRVLTDQDFKFAYWPSAFNALEDAGIEVRTANWIMNRPMHNKFVVVDQKSVWTGDWNAHQADEFLAHHSALKITDLGLASIYSDYFNRLYEGIPPEGLRDYPKEEERSVRLGNGVLLRVHYIPAESGSQVVARELAKAEKEIVFAEAYLGDLQVLNELAHASWRGVAVRGLYQNSTKNAAASLAIRGVDIRRPLLFLGSKYIVIDGRTVVTGSWNASADHPDYDNLIVIKGDIGLSQDFLMNFDAMFSDAVPYLNPGVEREPVEPPETSEGGIERFDPTPIHVDASPGSPVVEAIYVDRSQMILDQSVEVWVEVSVAHGDSGEQYRLVCYAAPRFSKYGEGIADAGSPVVLNPWAASAGQPPRSVVFKFACRTTLGPQWQLYARIIAKDPRTGRQREVGLYEAPFFAK